MEQQREDKQPLLKPSAVVAAGLAASVAAFFTSRFGITGTILGMALTAMIITGGSALFGFYLERAAAKARSVPGAVRVRPPRRSVLLGGSLFLAAVASFVVGMGVVTGVELSVGKSLSCWVWNECPTNDDSGGAASGATTGTRPSILGGGQRTAAPVLQPGGVVHPRQTTAPREQRVPDSPHAPQGRPAGGGGVRPEPREAPQSRAAPAQDAGPHQAPGGRQSPQEERQGGAPPPDGQAPKEQPSAAPDDSDQPSPSDEPSADRNEPPADRPVQPSP